MTATNPEKKDAESPKPWLCNRQKSLEIKEAADKLGLENEVNLEAHFPKECTWAKTGMLLVEKNEAKEKIIQKLAKQLVKIKSQQQLPPAKH